MQKVFLLVNENIYKHHSWPRPLNTTAKYVLNTVNYITTSQNKTADGKGSKKWPDPNHSIQRLPLGHDIPAHKISLKYRKNFAKKEKKADRWTDKAMRD